MMIAWAVGGEGDMLPENVGLPLGNEDGRPTFFMLETHYDNPQIFSGDFGPVTIITTTAHEIAHVKYRSGQ